MNVVTDDDWRASAACRGLDPEWWHPMRDSPRHETALALDICASCPVKAPCLEYALTNPHGCVNGPPGIWGGTSHRYRIALLKAARARTMAATG